MARSKNYLLASQLDEFATQELSNKTLPDFEKLFGTHPAPGAYPCWCMYNHRPCALPKIKKLSSSARARRNRQQKKELVEEGRSHGIIVYAHGEPVGWCQYGSKEELPRIESNPTYRKLAPQNKLWRITCFVVDKKYRRRGVASVALQAALESIRKKGGGLVEAFPIRRWGAYQDYRGTVSMFEKEGFEVVAPLGKNNVVMRKTI